MAGERRCQLTNSGTPDDVGMGQDWRNRGDVRRPDVARTRGVEQRFATR